MSIRGTIAIVGVSLLVACSAATSAAAQAGRPILSAASSDPRHVAGGDVLLRVEAPSASTATLTLNGAPAHIVRRDLAQDDASALVLIDGLKLGRNVVSARVIGRPVARLVLTNHAASGPVFPGADVPITACRTEESGLGQSTDGTCAVEPRIEYFYRSTANIFKPLADRSARPSDLSHVIRDSVPTPYIVRVESGVIDRSIYRFAVLDDPSKNLAQSSWRPGAAWNKRLVVFFGGGCGAHYAQGGDDVSQALSDLELSRGYAYAVSPSLVNEQFCSPLIQGEALMMIKQRFIKSFAPPVWTLGSGASGGAIQQYTIAEMFPGLLDGIQPGASFPDSQLQPATDCYLLSRAFAADPDRWTKAKRDAVSGASASTCADWIQTFAHNLEAVPPPRDVTNPLGRLIATAGGALTASPYPCDVKAAGRLFNKLANPTGLRCSQYDIQANQLGRERSGAGRRPFDNVGVQYGLGALKSGTISFDDFIVLNAAVGGFDHDGALSPQRTSGDPIAIRNAHRTGLMNGGGGGLARVPIITLRNYVDRLPAGNAMAIHDRLHDLTVRARLARTTGAADNQVIWTTSALGAVNLKSLALDLASRWLDALAADPRQLSAGKVVATKPSDAVDACWSSGGEKIVEVASLSSGERCNRLYPFHSEPRMVAGEGVAQDVMKCRLTSPRPTMYPPSTTAPELARLKTVFPRGVCDFGQPGVGSGPFVGPFLER